MGLNIIWIVIEVSSIFFLLITCLIFHERFANFEIFLILPPMEINKLIFCGLLDKKDFIYILARIFFLLNSSVIGFGRSVNSQISNSPAIILLIQCQICLVKELLMQIQGILKPSKLSSSLMVLDSLRKMECCTWNL